MFLAPILSLAFMVLGNSFFLSFLSLHLKELGYESMYIGMVQAFFYVGLLLSSIKVDVLIGKVGHIRVIAAASGALCCSFLGLYFFRDIYGVILLRIIAGLSVGAFYIGIESWMLAESHHSKRGRTLAIYTMVLYFAQASGQLLLGFTEGSAEAAYILTGLLVSLSVMPVCLSFQQGPKIHVAEAGNLLGFVRVAPLGFTSCLISGFVLSSLYAFMPIYVNQVGHSASIMMATLIGGGALLQWPIGRCSDLFDRRKVLGAVSLIALVPLLGLSIATNEIAFGACIFILGGLCFTIYPLSMALSCDCVEQKDIVRVTGALLLVYSIGAVIGPLLTPIGDLISDSYLLVMLALYLASNTVVSFFAIKRQHSAVVENKSGFTALAGIPLTKELHPNLELEEQAPQPSSPASETSARESPPSKKSS